MSSQRSPIYRDGPSFLFFTVLVVIEIFSFGLKANELHVAEAQVTTSITPTGGTGSLGTVVSPPVGNTYNITGGTRAGSNLFHSFGNFGVGAGDTANFLNTPINGSLPLTSNILGRVTGRNISNIFGTIQTTGYGNANLFLMNPAGFLFGPSATVNVGGMVTFTSADYLKLADGGRFNANPSAIPVDILTAADVAAFGFLGSNPGAIAIQGSQFVVGDGTGISLVGGNITIQAAGTAADGTPIQPAHLSAPGGQINLVSVAGPGEVQLANFEPSSAMALRPINLSQGTIVDVSGNAGGTVRIRGGSLLMDTALISADSVDANGAIDINMTGNVSIAAIDSPALTARTTGAGNAGEIRISSGSMDVTATSVTNFFSVIDTTTSGTGNAGTVHITTGDLTVAGGLVNFIDTGTSGPNPGRGGDVTITAHNIQMEDATITTGNFTASFIDGSGAGTAGNVTITADSLRMAGSSQIVTDSTDFVSIGRGGDIILNVRNIDLETADLSSQGYEHGGAIKITADQILSESSLVQTLTVSDTGGPITVNAKTIELTDGASFASNTVGNGNAGSISIVATDHFSLGGSLLFGRPSAIITTSSGAVGTAGAAGDIFITTPRLDITSGARIDTSTATSGHGGNVTIHATGPISMSGEAASQSVEPLFNLGSQQPSGIYTRTVGGHCSGLCGNAGNISITTGSMTTGSGAQINSGTSSNGQGGNITITAANTVGLSGTLSTGQAGGIQSRTTGADPDAGAGGNIALTASQGVTISNGASVSASSRGPGNTGNILINAGNQFAMTNSSVTTQANQASGGIIKITTNPNGTVQLTNSTISASVLDGAGGGGSVNIDPQFVILLNSKILANAVQGPGGNISITTNLLLPDASSVISASSKFGVNGTVTIQSPNAPGAGEIQPLGKSPLLATSLLNQRCASLAGGEFSSFTVAGRDSLPTEPGSWLASPLYAAGVGTGLEARGEGRASVGELAGETPLLSLRQIAPAGFLTQAFAVDWSASCTS